MTVENILDGLYIWNVRCYDLAGNDAFNSTNFTFYADTTIPSIQITSPIDNFNTTSSTILFNWTALDNLDIELLCNLTIDTVVNRTYLSSANGSAVNVSVAGFNASAHTIKVSWIDNATNSNTALATTIYAMTAGQTATCDGYQTSGGNLSPRIAHALGVSLRSVSLTQPPDVRIIQGFF